MKNFDTLLANINRNNIHPPPEIEVLNFFNSMKPMRDHNRCHAYKIFRYSVARECKRIGEFNAILIGRATNHLWKTSTSQEKGEYVNLAQRIFRYSVARECKRIGEFNAILIGRATNHLWKTSTSQEKGEYVNLAQRVKSH
ncbi:hypothetical protein Glove_43g57 [Diversispora epigaea]|uniref:HMG box domain-containing protein n=1 Tax=Diversispora epigaea TaxID=1348612 RepID=A0A397JFN0_9GLOM|nr:hypothetical protein Glove_43g57 [Diversispora epigaea]